MNRKTTFNRITKHLHVGLISMAMMAGFALIFGNAGANNPGFFFSTSSSCSFTSADLNLDAGQNQSVYLCIDGANEGSGFLGAEVSVVYDSNLLEVNSVSCQNFDSCSNLSGPGIIRLIGASGALPDGNAVTGRERLASISLNAKTGGRSSINFSVARVIDERNDVSSRIGVGLNVTITETVEPEVVIEAEPEAPVEEIVAEEAIPEITIETPIEDINDELFGLIITPLKKTGHPGDQIQIISRATYNGDRPDENTTSCFPCPTAGNNEAEGSINYQIVSGPASMYGSKLNINPNANAGDKIYIKATFTDAVSGSNASSLTHSITVTSPAQENPVEDANDDNQNPPQDEKDEILNESENQEVIENEVENETEENNEIENIEGENEVIEAEVNGGNGLILNMQNKNLICHINEKTSGKYTGELIYLYHAETKNHLENHPNDYEINQKDDNPNNDIESCLGVSVIEILPLSKTNEACCASCEVEITSKPQNSYCALNFSSVNDEDEDGLSDRTECYLNTDHLDEDSDDDGCWDGDEINQFQSNPLERSDCSLNRMVYENVIISDPKIDWIVRYLDISGTTPQGTSKVDLTAYPAEYNLVKNMVRSLETLNSQLDRIISPQDEKALEEQEEIINEMRKELETTVENFETFVETYNTSDYRDLERLVMMLETFITQENETLFTDLEMGESLLDALKERQEGAVFLGSVNPLKEVGLGDEIVSGFHLIPELDMKDGVYDLVAIASLDNRMITSEPVRIQLDHNANVSNPMPQALDGISLNPETVRNLEVDPESILRDVKVTTKNGRPVVTGQSTYGAQIFASWESLTLASSIIVDSNEGIFEMQAPRYLERNEDHKITLYAVIENDNGRVRSDSISVDFKVNGQQILFWALGLLILMGLAAGIAARRMKKIDQLPPEHRAKENELYHAFGEKERDTELPKDHQKKQNEVEVAFNRK